MERDMEREEDQQSRTAPAGRGAKSINRRAALARLGVVAGAAYVAPTLALLQGAKASGTAPSGPGWIKPTKPGSGPSKPKPGSRPSK